MRMSDPVEHQATVEKGLKMKIKRKNPTPKCLENRNKSSEDKNGNIKSQKNKTEYVDPVADVVSKMEEASTKVESPPAEKSQKRGRSGKNGKQIKSKDSSADGVKYGNEEELVKKETSRKDKSKEAKSAKAEKLNKGKSSACSSVMAEPVTESKISKNIHDGMEITDDAACSSDENLAMKMETGEGDSKTGLTVTHSETTSECSTTNSHLDPYEFVAKVEDSIQTPKKKFKSEKVEVTNSCEMSVNRGSHCDVGTETCSVAVMTDLDLLGPCEPGTSVILEGIVWSESNNGILVVNVTWRGKTYVGTLMDATRHHWASPRFRDESPLMELGWKSPKSKRGCASHAEPIEGRRLRKCRRNGANNNGTTTNNRGAVQVAASRLSPLQPESSGSRRRGKPSESNTDQSTDSPVPKKMREALPCDAEEMLFECKGQNCSKKFKHAAGLRYHQSHAHNRLPTPSASADEVENRTVKATAAEVSDNVRSVKKVNSDDSLSTTCSSSQDKDISTPVDSPKNKLESNPTKVQKEDLVTEVSKKQRLEKSQIDSSQDNVLTSIENDTISVQSESIISKAVPCSSQQQVISQVPSVVSAPIDKLQIPRSSPEPQPQIKLENCQAQSDAMEVENLDSSQRSLNQDSFQEPTHMEKDVSQIKQASPVFSEVASLPIDGFHKPILKTPDVNKHWKPSDHRPNSHSSMSTPMRPQNLAVKVSPGFNGVEDDKSPAYSDISDTNEAASFSENDSGRSRKVDELNKVRKSEKLAEKPIKTERHSPFLMPSIVSSTALHKQKELNMKPSFNFSKEVTASADLSREKITNCSVSSGMKQSPVDRSGSSLTPDHDAGIKNQQDFTNKMRLHMQQQQQQQQQQQHQPPPHFVAPGNNMSSMYGYQIDPLYHMQLLSASPEYRSQYERMMIEQQYHYHQMIRVENERQLSTDLKPVDMSAKGVVGHSNGTATSQESKPKVGSQKLDNKPPMKLSSGGDNSVKRVGTEKRHDSMPSSSEELRKSNASFSEKFTNSLKDRPYAVKQEPLSRARESLEKDDKQRLMQQQQQRQSSPLPKKNSSKAHEIDSPGSHGAVNSAKIPNLVGSIPSHPTGYAQHLKGSLPSSLPYDPSYPSMIGYSGPSFLESPLSGGCLPNSRYTDRNGKYPSGEKLPSDKTQSSRPGSASAHKPDQTKDHSGGGKESRRMMEMDDFAKEGSPSDKPGSLSSGQKSPLTLRHLHTHHHTHVVGAAYPLYGSYNGLVPGPTLVPPVVPVIPPTYIPK